MPLTDHQIQAFQKKIVDLTDTPSENMSPADLKAYFDSSPEELRVAVNSLIDDLTSTTAGASGAKQIGVETISGLTGNDVQTLLQALKTKLDNKTDKTGDHAGTWQGLTPGQASEAINGGRLDVVEAELADIAINATTFGLVGDGIADDTTSIQNALNHAYNNGFAKVTIPKGKICKTTSTLTIPYGVLLEGLGMATISYEGTGDAFGVGSDGGYFQYGGLRNLTIEHANNNKQGNGIYIDGNVSRITEKTIFENVIVKGFEYGIHIKCEGVIGVTVTHWKKIVCKENRIGFFLEGITNASSSRPWFNLNNFENCIFGSNVNGGFYIKNFGSVQALNFKTCDFSVNGEGSYGSTMNEAFGFKCDDKAEVHFDSCYVEFNYLFRKPIDQAEIDNFTTNGTLTSKNTYLLGNEEYDPSWGVFLINVPDSNDTAGVSVRWAKTVSFKNCIIANNTRYIHYKYCANVKIDNCQWLNSIRTQTNVAKALVEGLYSQVSDPAFPSSVHITQLITVATLPRVSVTENIPIVGNAIESNSFVEDLKRGTTKTIYVDSVNGDDAQYGLSDKPVKTLKRALDLTSVFNHKFYEIILKEGTNVLITTGATFYNVNVRIKSANSANKSTLTFQKITSQNALSAYKFVKSYIELENINLVLDWSGATSGINGTYAFETPQSSLRMTSVDVSSNNQYLAIQGVSVSFSQLELYLTNLNGTTAIVSKKIGSGKIETSLYGGNVATSGWTGILGQV